MIHFDMPRLKGRVVGDFRECYRCGCWLASAMAVRQRKSACTCTHIRAQARAECGEGTYEQMLRGDRKTHYSLCFHALQLMRIGGRFQ